MKWPTIRTFTEMTSYSKTEKKHYLEIEEWELHRYLFYQLYHYYDMRFPIRVPGWRKLEHWLGEHGAERLPATFGPGRLGWLADKVYGWSVNQDFRCYSLSQKKKVFFTLPLHETQAKRLRWGEVPSVILPEEE